MWGGALSPGGACFVPLDVWKWRQGPAGRLAPGSALFDQGWAAVHGKRTASEELVSNPWGSRALSVNTEGRWGAPGNVLHRGHRTMLW